MFNTEACGVQHSRNGGIVDSSVRQGINSGPRWHQTSNILCKSGKCSEDHGSNASFFLAPILLISALLRRCPSRKHTRELSPLVSKTCPLGFPHVWIQFSQFDRPRYDRIISFCHEPRIGVHWLIQIDKKHIQWNLMVKRNWDAAACFTFPFFGIGYGSLTLCLKIGLILEWF